MLVVVTTVGVIGGALAAGYALRQDAGPVRPAIEVRPSKLERPPPVTRPAIAPAIARIGPEPSAEVRGHRLDMPVQGMASAALQASFNDKRGERVHEAIDILAPRNSAVVAVEDGVIAKLFVSQAGGITIYQFDPTTSYSYYYAHLERYATGLRDGGRVRRGEVIGYVGTTGNAPKDTPHLHFAIFKLSDTKQWWQGAPIDPYDVLR